MTSPPSKLKDCRQYGVVDWLFIPDVLEARPSNKNLLRRISFQVLSDRFRCGLTRVARLNDNNLQQQYGLLKLQLSRPKWKGWASSDIRLRMFLEKPSAYTEWKDTAVYQCFSMVWNMKLSFSLSHLNWSVKYSKQLIKKKIAGFQLPKTGRLKFYRSYIVIINIRDLSEVFQNPETQRTMWRHE